MKYLKCIKIKFTYFPVTANKWNDNSLSRKEILYVIYLFSFVCYLYLLIYDNKLIAAIELSC